MTAIDKIIKIQEDKAKLHTLYSVLGRYGDLLSDTVQKELRTDAEFLQKNIDRRVESFKL